MITRSEIVEEFKFMGIEKLEDEVIIQCMEIAASQKIDAERLVEEWITFAQTNLGGNLQPTLTALNTMVRKQFDKSRDKLVTKSEQEKQSVKKIKVYNSNNTSDVRHILKTYNAGTPKKTAEDKRKHQEDLEELSSFSPATYNPDVCKLSTTYTERTDRGKELEIFGSKELLEQDLQVVSNNAYTVQVKLSDDHETWNFASAEGRYMFENECHEADAINNRIDRIGHLLIQKYETDNNKACLKYGRVRCDGEGRLNIHSVLLETSQNHGKGESLCVNLQGISKFALYPGQIILLQATLQTNSLRQNVLMAEQLYNNAIAELPKEKPIIVGPGPMNIIVACGPYTLSDNLAYQPLQDLIKYIVANKPHVVILIGPFVDKRHSSVADGTMAETYRTHFLNLIEQITTPLKNINPQVILVPSLLDAHHHSVYPTPPFDPISKRFNSSHIHMASDPTLISLNDLVVGVTSADVLFHLAKTEFIHNPYNTDRMARLAEYILLQRSFYPIYPPQHSMLGQNCFSVDQQLMTNHAEFNIIPHILILPSNLKHFVKNVNGCIVINPERLTKGFVGGTFASINVYSEMNNSSVDSQITCRIIKI